MQSKRKIGIGVCGVADALLKMGLPYGDPASIRFAHNIMSFINFTSKLSSVSLAKTRSPFEAFA